MRRRNDASSNVDFDSVTCKAASERSDFSNCKSAFSKGSTFYRGSSEDDLVTFENKKGIFFPARMSVPLSCKSSLTFTKVLITEELSPFDRETTWMLSL